MISRALTWKMYANISGTWTDISSDVLIGGNAINAHWGIRGNSETDRMAQTGVLTFFMNNVTGKYSPDLSGAMAGWKKGTPIRLVMTWDGQDYVRFYGKIDNLTIDAGTKKKRRVMVTVTDWLDYAAEYPLTQPQIETYRTADEAIDTIVNRMPIKPHVQSFDTGDTEFPVVFNAVTENTRAYSEILKLTMSEMGYCYLRKDPTYGETLVFESETHRNGAHPISGIPSLSEDVDHHLKEDGDALLKEDGGYLLFDEMEAFAIDNTTTDLNVTYGSNIINSMKITAYPKEVDSAATTVLFTLNQPIMLTSGETQEFTARYTDPSGGGRRVNGMNMVTPVITTDYLFNTLENGTGSNISTSLDVVATFGAESVTYILTNNHTGIGYVTHLQIRGKGIYNYNPISYTAENNDSQLEYGVFSRSVNQPYQVTLGRATSAADAIVEREKQPRTVLNTVHFTPNTSDQLMRAFLNIDIGDVVAIAEDQTGIDGQYWINGVEFSILDGKVIKCRWHVKHHLAAGSGIELMAVEVGVGGEKKTDAILYGAIPEATNLTERTISAWIYCEDTTDIYNGVIMGAWSEEAKGFEFQIGNFTTTTPTVYYRLKNDTSLGMWATDYNILPFETWTHVAVTRDNTAGTIVPLIYVGGTAKATVEHFTPDASVLDESACQYTIGNIIPKYMGGSVFTFRGQIRDARIYNRILSADEVASLAGGGTVIDGLVFQGPAVYNSQVADYTDKTLTVTDKVIEAINYRAGTPHGEPIAREIT
jgi:hypothetical protein